MTLNSSGVHEPSSSGTASVAIVSPDAIGGRRSACAAASPLASSAPAASTALARYGALSSAAPISSHTTSCSTGPRPAPPYFSGTASPLWREPGFGYATLSRVLVTKTTAEWLAFCADAGIPAAAATGLDELIDALPEDEHPDAGRYKVIPPPARFSATPASVRRAAPLVGQHTREVLAEGRPGRGGDSPARRGRCAYRRSGWSRKASTCWLNRSGWSTLQTSPASGMTACTARGSLAAMYSAAPR